VSLRTEIHSAFDEVAPPTFGMPERVVQTVLTESPSRRRREQLMLRMRVPLSLVAVFMLIALVVGLLIGGRLMQDWNTFHNGAPAGRDTQSMLAQLEARPLHLPAPATKLDCVSTPVNAGGSLGKGPVYADPGGIWSITSWGTYFHIGAHADTNVVGPVLVRATDLFTHVPVVFVGQYAAGPVVGQDTLDGVVVDQHTELVFDTSHASKGLTAHKFVWPITSAAPASWSGSTGWQIDGVGFSDVFVVC
jgi:hypothetical protein